MAVGRVLTSSVILLSLSLLSLYSVDSDSPKHFGNAQAGLGDNFLQFCNISLHKFKPKLLADLTRAGGHFVSGHRKTFLKSRVAP